MASAIAFLMKKRYESIVASKYGPNGKKKHKLQKIAPPPESTDITAVWFWKLRDVAVTVMLNKETKEVWCNGEVPSTTKISPTKTGERSGLSFQIKVPNVEYQDLHDLTSSIPTATVKLTQTPDNGNNLATEEDNTQVACSESNRDVLDMEDVEMALDDDACQMSSTDQNKHVSVRNESAVDPNYFDAIDDMADTTDEHDPGDATHNPTLHPDASNDAALSLESTPDVPQYFYHEARITHFMVGEDSVYELYVDGSMIQEHTKALINCADEKSEVAKKKD